MGKKKSSPPPKASLPGPSKTELEIQAQQLELMKKESAAYDQYSAERVADRGIVAETLDKLASGAEITPYERDLIDRWSRQYQDMVMTDISSGVNREQFDTARSQNIGNLIERGVLNSTTGQRVIGDIEKERSRLIATAAQDAAMNKLKLEADFYNNAQNKLNSKANIYAGFAGQGGQLASAAGQNSASIGTNLGSALSGERYMKANIDNQNAQAQWMWQRQNQKNGGGLGSMIGMGVGMLAAPFTGGLSLAGGAALGGTLGGAAGSFF